MSRRRDINLGAYALIFLILPLGSAICASVLALVQANYEARCARGASTAASDRDGATDESPGQVAPGGLQTPALPAEHTHSNALARTPRIAA